MIYIIYHSHRPKKLKINLDQYKTLPEITKALQTAGLESCNVIIGIDFTRSNEWQGEKTMERKNLHHIFEDGGMNPYQQVIDVCSRTLDDLDDDKMIPTFGFGCVKTRDKACFSFTKDEPRGCMGFEEVGERYKAEVKTRTLSGPTNFAPVINKAIEIVEETGNQFHVLIIICDGQVSDKQNTVAAIIAACKYPLAIIIIGVGDGDQGAPKGKEWETMMLYDDGLPERDWDNVQFVPFNRLGVALGKELTAKQEIKFAVAAMQELPDQFKTVKRLGLLNI
ncbi:VWA domain-containing protein [Candidatus Babeliales bacterium]|nr:VWA domain-containing protein [Candidatus Babeliales bacterium]